MKGWERVARIIVLGLFTLGASGQSDTEPALGVARVSLTNGDVTVRRGDSGDWVEARVNTPLVEGDSVATGEGSRAEVQLGVFNIIRLNELSEVHVAGLGNRRFRVQLVRGMVNYSEPKEAEADIDIETSHVAVRPMEPGSYSVEISSTGATIITVRKGKAEVASPEGVETLNQGRRMIVRDVDGELALQVDQAPGKNDWDRWNDLRDRGLRKSNSRRYVSAGITGVEDLDDHGRWSYVSGYGYSWFPAVSVGWAPYRHGRWVWIDYYGWTWHGYEPWGWAPYHYGRWFHHARHGWGWYPGLRYGRHHWRPALVAFFGYGHHSGFSFGLGFGSGYGYGHIGWVPLAPYERYYPWYGRGYYGRGGGYGGGGGRGGRGGNTTIIVDNSVNIYNNYRNARARNGVTLVDAQGFSRGRMNSPRSLRASELRRATLMRGQIPVIPTRQSQGNVVRASSGQSSGLRSINTFSRGRASQARPQRQSFSNQQQQLGRSLRAFSDARTASAQRGARTATAASTPAGGVRSGAAAAGSVRGGGVRSATAGRSTGVRSGSVRGGSNRTQGRSFDGTAISRRAERSQAPATSNSAGVRGAVRSGSRTSTEAQTRSWRRFGNSARIRGANSGGRSTAGSSRTLRSETRVGGVRVDRGRSRSGNIRSTDSNNAGSGSRLSAPSASQSGGNTRGVIPRSRSRVTTQSRSGSRIDFGVRSSRTTRSSTTRTSSSLRSGGGFTPRSDSRVRTQSRSRSSSLSSPSFGSLRRSGGGGSGTVRRSSGSSRTRSVRGSSPRVGRSRSSSRPSVRSGRSSSPRAPLSRAPSVRSGGGGRASVSRGGSSSGRGSMRSSGGGARRGSGRR